MNNDIFGGFMAIYIIASALYSFTLLRFSDTDDLRILGFNIWQNVFKELFFYKNAFGIIIGIICFILQFTSLVFCLIGQVVVWIMYGFIWLYRKGEKK